MTMLLQHGTGCHAHMHSVATKRLHKVASERRNLAEVYITKQTSNRLVLVLLYISWTILKHIPTETGHEMMTNCCTLQVNTAIWAFIGTLIMSKFAILNN